jgi:osmotically-inducible protein OsmY
MKRILQWALGAVLVAVGATRAEETASTTGNPPVQRRSTIPAQNGTSDETLAPAEVTAHAPTLPTPKEGPLDRALSAKVRAALASKDSEKTTATGPSTRSDIQVSSFHGVVTLRGKVNSQSEKQALVDKVQSLGGVTIVKNELQVTAPPIVSQGSPGEQGLEHGSDQKALKGQKSSSAQQSEPAK